MGVIRHSGNRKIDVEELRQTLAVQLKAAKHGTDPSSTIADSVPTRMKSASGQGGGQNRSRSRSKGHTHANISQMTGIGGMPISGSMAEARSSAATLKLHQDFEDESAVPAWYKTLKKNVRE